MKRIGGAVAGIIILLLLCSGAFADITRFFAWLFTLQYSQPDTSVPGGIIVRVLTFIVSYSLVAFIFNLIGLFNSKVMSIFYLIISTLLGFAFAYLVWTIEQYILVIGIVMGAVALLAMAGIVVVVVLNKKKERKTLVNVRKNNRSKI